METVRNSWFSSDFWFDFNIISSNFLLRKFFENIIVKCTNFIKLSCIFTVFCYFLFIFSSFFLSFFFSFLFIPFFFSFILWEGVPLPPSTAPLRTPLFESEAMKENFLYSSQQQQQTFRIVQKSVRCESILKLRLDKWQINDKWKKFIYNKFFNLSSFLLIPAVYIPESGLLYMYN